MKKTTNVLLLIICLATFSSFKNKTVEIYVSPGGKTDNKGTKEAPLSDIRSAINMAKTIKQDNKETPISIILQSGDYHLESPIIIPAGLSDFSLLGAGSSKTAIKGSAVLNLNWEKYNGNIFVSKVDDVLNFDQFIANGKLQILARYPNYNEQGGHFQGHAADAFSAERIKTWKNPVGTIVNTMHSAEWGDFHYVIKKIDRKGNPVLEGGHQNNRPSPPHKLFRMVENVFEELDSPGEWYLDKENNLLYYWPIENLDINSTIFEGVILKTLIEIKGEEENPVQNVSIRGIKFEYTQRTFLEEYEQLLRSDWTIYRGGAIFIEGAENCAVEDCEFTNLGGNVIFVSSYNRGIEIKGNHIHECGASGICFVGDPGAVRSPSFQYKEYVPLKKIDTKPGPKSNLYPKDCIAYNNLIYRTGRHEKQTAGVQIAMAMNITVSHNSIYDMPRAGINIGDGTWGGHILEFNDVFNTVLESGDHGSFNSWGRDRFWHPNRRTMNKITQDNPKMPNWDAINTTIIRNNRFRCDHGWDIDLDDGSSNYRLYNNLCLNGGIKLREGFYRVVENNIMINNGFHPHVWFGKSDDVFRKNIVTFKHQDIRLDGWGKEVDYNLFSEQSALEDARKKGVDENSISGDPLFRAPQNLDFSVKENSPAFKLGFVNFPMDSFGVLKPELREIAKTPKIPELKNLSDSQSCSETAEWLGAKIKNIETMAERSASGLSKTAGVLIMNIGNGSALDKSGLQIGDVIIGAEGKEIDNIDKLLKIYEEAESKGTLKLLIFRNQSELVLTIKTE